VVLRPGTNLEGLQALAQRMEAKGPAVPRDSTLQSTSGTPLPRLEVQDLRIELVSSKDGRPLDLGAWDAQVEVSSASSGRVLELAVQRDGGGEARTTARWARDQPIQLETVVESMRRWPLVELPDSGSAPRVQLGSVNGSPTDPGGASSRRGVHDGLFLEGARLALEPVGPWRPPRARDRDRGSREICSREGHIGFGEKRDLLRSTSRGVPRA
jgi:hypothetical protein